jgi:hypothetical protein
MKRSSSRFTVCAQLAGALGALLAGCNAPTCGAGTVQLQHKDGSIECLPADGTISPVTCDLDGGAVLSGGLCRSGITCGDGTTLVNGQCIATGGGDALPACPPPDTGKICVNGIIHQLVDGTKFAGRIHVAYYSNPFDFLNGINPEAVLDSSDGTYQFANVSAPTLKIFVIAFGEADLATTNNGTTIVTSGVGGSGVQPGKSYRVDGYAVQRTTVQGWSDATGVDWFAQGGYIARYYNDPKPVGTNLAANETHPVAGVTMANVDSNGHLIPLAPPNAMYFSTDLTKLDKTMTVTGVAGAAIAPPPVDGIASFGGSGGGLTWETEQGGSAKKVIFVSRFHPAP